MGSRSEIVKDIVYRRAGEAPDNYVKPGVHPAAAFNEFFGKNVFNEHELRKRVPKTVVAQLKACAKRGEPVDRATADVVATAMKEWALERGATHFTHWFQPLRCQPAEKHDSFVDFTGPQRDLKMDFSGSLLVRGEPDGSSFPSGGLRNTAEARGYTAWDPSSPPVVIDGPNGGTLLIPAMFLSWTGEALDVKTPLLRSVTALSQQATRLAHFLGKTDVTGVESTLGAEQEFFLVDRSYFLMRQDLLLTGRTVLGAPSAIGQEEVGHYFAEMPERVLAYIQDVELELWKLGYPCKTRHNEVAPGQHEMAPVFENSNVAADHNQYQMLLMNRIGSRHNLQVLFHEKPFAGINGSGKHNNWSLATDTGINLLEPTSDPENVPHFLATLAVIIRAVDEHQDVLRASVAGHGQDHRLGAQEAPPAIMSIYLGEQLDQIVRKLIVDEDRAVAESKGEDPQKVQGVELLRRGSKIAIGGDVSPLKRDRTDRNRTSPFAFTGNKFEFRAPGSSSEVGHTVTMINTMVADSMSKFNAEVQKLVDGGMSAAEAVKVNTRRTMKAHYRIVFNGDGYSEAWVEEAAQRGLLNNRDSVSALKCLNDEKNLELFESQNVLTREELKARQAVYLEHYATRVAVEVKVALDMARTHVISAATTQQHTIADAILKVKSVSDKIPTTAQTAALERLSASLDRLISACNATEEDLKALDDHDKFDDDLQMAEYVRDTLVPRMAAIRKESDELELLVADGLWTLPRYHEMTLIK